MSFRTYHDINLDFYLFSVFFRYILFSFLGSSLSFTDFSASLMVENKGLEPLTPCVQGRCSPS